MRKFVVSFSPASFPVTSPSFPRAVTAAPAKSYLLSASPYTSYSSLISPEITAQLEQGVLAHSGVL